MFQEKSVEGRYHALFVRKTTGLDNLITKIYFFVIFELKLLTSIQFVINIGERSES